MGTFLICCLWGQGWIGATAFRALGWLWSLILRRDAGAHSDDCPLLLANGDCPR